MANTTGGRVEIRRLGTTDLDITTVGFGAAAGSLHLTADDLAEISAALHRTGAGSGPTDLSLRRELD